MSFAYQNLIWPYQDEYGNGHGDGTEYGRGDGDGGNWARVKSSGDGSCETEGFYYGDGAGSGTGNGTLYRAVYPVGSFRESLQRPSGYGCNPCLRGNIYP